MVSHNNQNQQSQITAVPINQHSTPMTQATIEVFSLNDNTFNMNRNDISIFTKENVIKKDNKGRTAIHAACYLGKSNILIYMMSLFSNEEKREIASMVDNNGVTPAHYSCGHPWE